MRDLNKVIVSGRATKNAEYKEVNETKIATFTMACNYGEEVSYLPVACFGGLAEKVVSQYVTKGKSLQVEGRLKQERFENKEGVNCSRIMIIAQKIYLQGTSQKAKTKPSKAKN